MYLTLTLGNNPHAHDTLESAEKVFSTLTECSVLLQVEDESWRVLKQVGTEGYSICNVNGTYQLIKAPKTDPIVTVDDLAQ